MRYPPFDAIFLPTDFEPTSLRAFHHALFMALEVKGALRVLHVHQGERDGEFPHVRETLARWNRLTGSEDLGIEVTRVETTPGDPVERILHDVGKHDPNLIVMATHGHEGISRLLARQVAEPVLRKANTPTLLFPGSAKPFVSEWGELSFDRILVPVVSRPDPQLAVEGAARLIQTLNVAEGEVHLLHIRDGSTPPEPRLPDIPGWRFTREDLDGEVVDTLLLEARARAADVLVLASQGRTSATDWLFGSTAERVLREAPCPVLVMPSRS